MPQIHAFQIFYDDRTRQMVRPPFTPLDNTGGAEGWFEMYPMLRYLQTHQLDPDAWYGFVSPKFFEKSLVTWDQVACTIASDPAADVALFSYNWPSLATSRNIWLHGEAWHPGLIDCSETFFRHLDRAADLRGAVTDFRTSVNSNYIFAKPRFWQNWRALAEAYFKYCTEGGDNLPDNAMTWHVKQPNYPMRTFVQERFASWILLQGGYTVVTPDYPREVALDHYPAQSRPWLTRRLLSLAERCKSRHRRTPAPLLLTAHRIFRRAAWEVGAGARHLQNRSRD